MNVVVDTSVWSLSLRRNTGAIKSGGCRQAIA